jgi:Skp family chaperone for outer membrane proteins
MVKSVSCRCSTCQRCRNLKAQRAVKQARYRAKQREKQQELRRQKAEKAAAKRQRQKAERKVLDEVKAAEEQRLARGGQCSSDVRQEPGLVMQASWGMELRMS